MINNSNHLRWERLNTKTLDQQFVRMIIDGLNCSPFEASAVLEAVYEVYRNYFDSSDNLKPGQIVIPASMRKKFGIQPGTEVDIFEYGNMIYIVPPSANPIEDAMGCLPKRPSLSRELLRERKRDIVK